MCYLNFIKATGKQGDSSIQCKSQCEEAETIRVLQPLQSVQLEKETDSTSEMKKKGLDPAPTEVNSKSFNYLRVLLIRLQLCHT